MTRVQFPAKVGNFSLGAGAYKSLILQATGELFLGLKSQPERKTRPNQVACLRIPQPLHA